MKPGSKSHPKTEALVLAFGAHPDDIEFGCGGVIAAGTRAGRKAHFIVCSRGESGTNGTPKIRTAEARNAASILGATIEFVEFDGDAHLEATVEHTIEIARMLRRLRPRIVLAPSLVENQHPDHWKLGAMVRDAARLARFGGLKELRGMAPHTIGHLFYYAVAPGTEPRDITPILVDVSDPAVVSAWKAAMEAHASQAATRAYCELHLARARVQGLKAGVEHAIPLFPNDPPLFSSLDPFR